MSFQSVPLLSYDFFPSRPIQVEVSAAPLSSDAGLLPVCQFDEQIRLTEQFAAAIEDGRDPTLTKQTVLTMVRQRIFGILADYEDQNDHDTLRSDPVFKLIADRLPDDPDLASQPTLSRFENAVSIPDLDRLRDVLVDLFIQSFDRPPGHLTLDLDAFDDPAHGDQQLIMFHGYYDQYQYLPIVITCAKTTWCSWQACGSAPVRRSWGWTTTCGTWSGGSGPFGPTCTSTYEPTAVSGCP